MVRTPRSEWGGTWAAALSARGHSVACNLAHWHHAPCRWLRPARGAPQHRPAPGSILSKQPCESSVSPEPCMGSHAQAVPTRTAPQGRSPQKSVDPVPCNLRAEIVRACAKRLTARSLPQTCETKRFRQTWSRVQVKKKKKLEARSQCPLPVVAGSGWWGEA